MDDNNSKLVTIALKPATKQQLMKLGAKSNSYDDIVQRLIELYNKIHSQN